MLQSIMPTAVDMVGILIALTILAASVAVAWLVRRLIRRLGKRAGEKTAKALGGYLIGPLHTPVFVAIVLVGVYSGLAYLPLGPGVDRPMREGLLVALAAVGIYAALTVINAFLRWYGKEVAANTKTVLDDKLISVLRAGVPIVGGLVGVLMLLRVVGMESHSVNAWLAGHGVRTAFIIVLAVAVFFAVSQWVPKVTRGLVRQGIVGKAEDEVEKRADTLAAVLVTTAHVVIIATTVFMVLAELGINIAPVLAGVGVAGVAIGFGAQSLVKDIITGLFIIMEGQFHVGDEVRVADVAGLVEGINLRRTVLRDLDGAVHFVPNGEIRVASNFTKEYSRVNLNISVSYDTDLDHAIAVINRVGRELAGAPEWKAFILKLPHVLRVDNLGDSGIEIKIVGDTKPVKQRDIMGELRKRIKEAFDREGIEMPFPHTKVYFGDSPLSIRTSRNNRAGRRLQQDSPAGDCARETPRDTTP